MRGIIAEGFSASASAAFSSLESGGFGSARLHWLCGSDSPVVNKYHHRVVQHDLPPAGIKRCRVLLKIS